MDSAAICKPKQEIIDAVIDVLQNHWGNASSINYDFGKESNIIVEDCRNKIAEMINCKPSEIIFCTSGSESNSLAINGFLSANKEYEYCVSSVGEHDSILRNPNVSACIGYTHDSFVNMEDVACLENKFVSIMYANNITGVINDIKKVTSILKKHNCVFHTDATAVFGHFPIDVQELGIDMMSVALQKISGVVGCAFLYVREGININPIVFGTQNNGINGGTYNHTAICAANIAMNMIDYNDELMLYEKRDYLLNHLLRNPNITLNGSKLHRLSNNLNICIHNVSIDNIQIVAMLSLDMYGNYIVSAGSACSSGQNVPNHVLTALGITDQDARQSIRITISNDNTIEDLHGFVVALNVIIEQFKI